MKIGELAQRSGCAVETIRYYEKAGVLPAPPRTGSGYRDYTAGHMASLQFIRQCRALAMGLDDIRALIALQEQPAAGCGSVDALVDQHIVTVDAQLASLQQLRAQLVGLRGRCGEPGVVGECAILRGLVTDGAKALA